MPHVLRSFRALAAVAAVFVAAPSSAGFTYLSSSCTYDASLGMWRTRAWANFDNPTDSLSAIAAPYWGASPPTNLFHDDLVGGSLAPQFANSTNDSYVTIGDSIGFGNTTAADGNWGGEGFNQPGIPNGAGWFNANPSAPVYATSGQILILNLLHTTPDLPLGFTCLVTYKSNGVNMFAVGQAMMCFPSPGAVAILGLAGLRSGRRRTEVSGA